MRLRLRPAHLVFAPLALVLLSACVPPPSTVAEEPTVAASPTVTPQSTAAPTSPTPEPTPTSTSTPAPTPTPPNPDAVLSFVKANMAEAEGYSLTGTMETEVCAVSQKSLVTRQYDKHVDALGNSRLTVTTTLDLSANRSEAEVRMVGFKYYQRDLAADRSSGTERWEPSANDELTKLARRNFDFLNRLDPRVTTVEQVTLDGELMHHVTTLVPEEALRNIQLWIGNDDMKVHRVVEEQRFYSDEAAATACLASGKVIDIVVVVDEQIVSYGQVPEILAPPVSP